MIPNLLDVWGALVACWYLASIGALTTLSVLMLWHLQPRTPLATKVAAAMTIFGLAYLFLYVMDVPGVLAVLTDSINDIPPANTLLTGFLAGLLT